MKILRKIIKIDHTKCDGCGLCVNACHENAIGIIDQKATLLRDDYCDGLGDCLPACPQMAISFIEREALPYDEEAVQANIFKKEQENKIILQNNTFKQSENVLTKTELKPFSQIIKQNQLINFPIQINLSPIKSPCYQNANLLIAADCTAYAYKNFHDDFMKDHVTLIGCPKLDNTDYAQKLCSILQNNNIKTIKIVKMEVPCCNGLEKAVKIAISDSKKNIPMEIITVSTQGIVL